MACTWEKVKLGVTGLEVSPLGIASSYGISAADVERAHERGINYFFWGSLRKADYGRGLASICKKKREGVVVAIQSYTRIACFMRFSVDRALWQLGIDRAEILILGWWNGMPWERILDAAQALKDKGKIGHVMISCHHRPAFESMIKDPRIGAIMVRYNAAHPGAEREVFPHLTARRPGVVAFTATRWGHLVDPGNTPAGEKTPRGSDCYRFCLSNPNVDVVLSGPKGTEQLDEAMAALDRGPLSADELAWMRRVGSGVRETKTRPFAGTA